MSSTSENLILIGMPGAGKSTLGVLLAKTLVRNFIDSDVMIQASEGKRLQEIIAQQGLNAFLDLESDYVCGLEISGAVIATGGSVVNRPASMAHLARLGKIIYLDVLFKTLEQRIGDLDSRGVARKPGQSLADLFEEREPLYRKYGQLTVNCSNDSHDTSIKNILASL